ncbi:hypothetical protein SAMD00023353_4300240 [Rosellinia necatrix]|uniref:Uncharacterized protein n=1 Tax=Rosellinia necatrix TaxID=77044 RepID=A0A1S8A9D0_ROSNE|nr:hypothetical protein SAMD00023353_4300240 [Rosellinia necatrix]
MGSQDGIARLQDWQAKMNEGRESACQTGGGSGGSVGGGSGVGAGLIGARE